MMESDQSTARAEQGSQQFDTAQLQFAMDQLRAEQNLIIGAVAGAAGAAVGAALWALITILTNVQIGWMAVAVGFLVGMAVRTFGKGIDHLFGVVGAVLALLGCGLGNLLVTCGIIASQQDMEFFEVLSKLDFQNIKELMVASFSPTDLLFYGIAVYEAYKLSFRRPTYQELVVKITGAPEGIAG